jgi:para-aminobenzoate synthetase component 1
VNLTGPFFFKFKGIDNPFNFIRKVWNKTLSVGAYAHGTYIDSLGKLYLSNSPECLFEVEKTDKGYELVTKPIKGTLKAEDESDKEQKWKELVASEKDQAELYMITDLLKNDLTKISMKPAVVTDKKLPLFVPGLVHQYSKIKVDLDDDTTIDQIIRATFPGGSITGAPKKRVMEIIHDVEGYERGFYCGSTIMLYKEAQISIN